MLAPRKSTKTTPPAPASASTLNSTPPPQSDPSQLTLNDSAVVQARLLSGNEWSPINSVRYLVGAPATAENLVVSELSYRPARPSPAEDTEGIYSRTDFEFIEFTNIPNGPIHLDGVEFDLRDANDFSITADVSLLLFDDQDAFLARLPAIDPIGIAGEYRGNLSNDGAILQIPSVIAGVISPNSPWACTRKIEAMCQT